MLYRLLKFPASIALYFYCRTIKINHPELLQSEGPLLLASNHPNSFLDAIIFASLFKRPVYSLTRGDAFAGKIFTRLLKSMNMLPVYRVSEGVENLEHNYTTFSDCIDIFKKNGIVLIFSEGRCINEWHLRPLKKGTARLAMAAWEKVVPLKVLPVGINYSSFRIFGKNVIINFGDHISNKGFTAASEGKMIQDFNLQLHHQLKTLVYEMSPNDKIERVKVFSNSTSSLKKIILFLPAAAGVIIHYPLYKFIETAIKKRAEDHYDSVMIGLLFLFYLPYIFLITLLVFIWSHSVLSLFLVLLIPLTALSLLHIKKLY